MAGLAASVRIAHTDPTLDGLTINSLAGADDVSVANAVNGLIQVTVKQSSLIRRACGTLAAFALDGRTGLRPRLRPPISSPPAAPTGPASAGGPQERH